VTVSVVCCCAAFLFALQASLGWAQEGADFYRGKTLRIVISTGVAGGFGEYARLLSEHIGKHIAGRPHVIVQSMPGAGGLLAANYLYASAPQDGTTIGIINSTVPLAPLWGSKGARFDTLKFNWLGTLDRAEGVCTVWHTSAVKTWEQMLARELTVGSIGAGSEMELYPAVLNRLFATKIKVVAGYKAGSDIDLAIERRELDGRCGTHLTSFRALHPRWFAERKINVPIIIAKERRGDLPDTPAIHGVRARRADPPAARADHGRAESRPSGAGAAGRAGRPRGRTTRGLGRHLGGCSVPRRYRAAQPARRPHAGRGDGGSLCAGVRVSARHHCRRARRDGWQVKGQRPQG
jgi:Tripartite tricarboxylate transporter family receptor